MLSYTLRQLEYIVAVAEQGGVSHAAETVNVSQPSLSVAIAKLEGTLGKAIFIRDKGNPLVLTAFGREFVEDARQILSDAERLVDPTFKQAIQRRPVAVGFFEDLAPLVLAPILKRLADTHPDVSITQRVLGFEKLTEGLASGELDFAVTYDLGLEQKTRREELMTLSPHALVSENHQLAGEQVTTLTALSKEQLILVDQGYSLQHMIDLFRQRELIPIITHRAASIETMRSLVGNDFGVGVSYTLPAAQRSYDGKRVCAIKISDQGVEEPIVLATSKANEPTHISAVLMNEVLGAFNLQRKPLESPKA